jgi:hypothetical protein
MENCCPCFWFPTISLCLKNSLRRDNLALFPDHPLSRLPHRNRERFEGHLGAAMVVISLEDIHVERVGLAEALHAVVDHLGGQIADFGVLEAEPADKEGPRRDVDDGT